MLSILKCHKNKPRSGVFYPSSVLLDTWWVSPFNLKTRTSLYSEKSVFYLLISSLLIFSLHSLSRIPISWMYLLDDCLCLYMLVANLNFCFPFYFLTSPSLISPTSPPLLWKPPVCSLYLWTWLLLFHFVSDFTCEKDHTKGICLSLSDLFHLV